MPGALPCVSSSSKNFQVFAPSNFRTLTDAMSAGFEVPQVDSVLGSFSWNQRLPVRYAAAGATVNGPHRSVALDVLGGGFRVPLDLYGTELIVDPGTTDATTKRAVAVRGHHGRGRQRQPNCAAVTRAFVHLSTFAVRWWTVRPGCSRRLTFDMSGGAKGAKRPLGRQLDGGVRRHRGRARFVGWGRVVLMLQRGPVWILTPFEGSPKSSVPLRFRPVA